MDSIRTLLHRISTDRDFALLETLRDASVWGHWPQEARHALALLFADHAARRLRGNLVEETFALAESMAPDCPLVATRRAMMHSCDINVESLQRAHAAFKQAYKRDPEGSLVFWEAWGNTLRMLALLQKDVNYAEEALCYYEKARKTTNHPEKLGRLFYHMAVCYYFLGETSEEAQEFTKALEMLEHALAAHFDHPCVNLLEAQCLSQLSLLLNRADLLQTALQRAMDVEVHLKSLSLHEQLLCTHLIATLATHCYKYTYDVSFFSLAHEYFNRALPLAPSPQVLHLELAQFLLLVGRICHEASVIKEALVHFAKSEIDMQAPSLPLADFAEGELILASYTEDLSYLRSAEKKMLACMHTLFSDPRVLSLHTLVLVELGRYFSDSAYFETALRLLKEPLETLPDQPSLWLSCAQVYLGLGDLTKKASFWRKACHAFGMVIECAGEETLHIYTDWAATLLRLGEIYDDPASIEKAVKLFETAITLGEKWQLGGAHPTQPFLDCLYSYGCALDCLGDCCQEILHYEKAIQVLSSVLIACPEHPFVRYNLAVTLCHLGEMTQDIEPLRKSIELFMLLTQEDPEDDIAWHEWGLALMHLAQILQDPGRPEEAESILLDAALKLLRAASLGNPRAHYYLACLYSLLENDQLAFFYLRKAIEEKCVPAIEQLVEEEWLKFVQADPAFQELLKQLSLNPQTEDFSE